jgi:hypothetical protein
MKSPSKTKCRKYQNIWNFETFCNIIFFQLSPRFEISEISKIYFKIFMMKTQ